MLKPIFQNILQPLLVSITGAVKRWVYNFDGVDDRGQLAFRAINPDGDIDVEWRSGPNISLASSRTIVSQTLTTSSANQEFFMFVATNGNLVVRVGGVERVTSPAIVYQPNAKYRWRLQGTTVELWVNDVLQPAMTFTRGTAREPTATTQIGSTANTFFYLGQLYDVRINGVLWPIADRNQTIQLPSPSGLGPELITEANHLAPAVKDSQWTYLGSGRWEYVGDGTQNSLRLVTQAEHPTAGFAEFEVESYSGAGTMRCSSGFNPANHSGNLFKGVGKYRCFYTSFADAGVMLEFGRRGNGELVSCVIKNISFKPLGTCNPLTLVNTASTGWQEVQS